VSFDFVQLLEPERVPFNLPIRHLSASSAALLFKCPRRWQEEKIHRRRPRPSEPLITGSAVHAVLERNFSQKITTHEDLPVLELREWLMDEGFIELVREEEETAGAETFWDEGSGFENARERAKVMSTAYRNTVAPRIQPIAVEKYVEVDLGLPVPVIGYIDIETEPSVIDVKTGKRASRMAKEEWRFGATVYHEDALKPIEFHSTTATMKTGAVTVLTPLEEEGLLVSPNEHERRELIRSFQAIIEMACGFMDRYGPDEPWPTWGRYHMFACDKCGFKTDCPAWRGREHE